MHAEHGHVLVVAASHLIFRLRQPSQALITDPNQQLDLKIGRTTYPLDVCDGCVHRRRHSLKLDQRCEEEAGRKQTLLGLFLPKVVGRE